MNILIIPYKRHNDFIQKFFIVDKSNKILHYNICNVYAPFGRQTELDHHTSNKLCQHRLNICFSIEQMQSKEYKYLTDIITKLENYFKDFEELSNVVLQSSIIHRGKYGVVIRFHLKTTKNNTTTPLILLNKENNEKNVEWVNFIKEEKINIKFHPDCLWINNQTQNYGISFIIDKVYQYIV